MAPCEECGGTGKVPETDVNSLLVEHTSQDFVDSLIQRGVFMLRMRDIDEIWNEGYETAKEQNRSGMLLQEDPELYNDLLEEAKRYERVVPNSPKGELLRRAAERCIKPVSNEDTV